MKNFLCIVLVCLPLLSLCQKDDAIIKFGKRDSIISKVLNQSRPYWIYLPPSYDDKSIQPIYYPVLYILDGDVQFKSVSSMVEILGSGINATHVIPEMIIVAPMHLDRTKELTPTHSIKGVDGKDWDYLQNSGGEKDFLKFMKDELIPEIDSRYRTFPFRTFIGHSFGGITVLDALFTMPQTFNAYVAIDPSLWWDNQVVLQQANERFKEKDFSGEYLYVAQANSLFANDPRATSPNTNIHFESIKKFASLLERQHSGVKWNYKYYNDDNHGSVALIAEYDALRFIFEKYYAPFSKIQNAEDLKKHFQIFSEESKVHFAPPEKVVNDFANIPLFFKRYDEAQGYYQLNIDNHPKSPGAYQNMGQSWLNQGNKKKALEYFEKSLLINPMNDELNDQVKRIKDEMNMKK